MVCQKEVQPLGVDGEVVVAMDMDGENKTKTLFNARKLKNIHLEFEGSLKNCFATFTICISCNML
jgi:hypothetical protein